MRRVRLGSSDIETSCIGFGCASLGSRVGAREGLRAIEAAFAEGVTWFDLAPIYGGGGAEAIIAPFLVRHRADVQVCTKVGFAHPKPPPAPKRLATTFVRRFVQAFPSLRGALRRSGVQTPRPLPLTAELLHHSLEESLRRLGTDYVDLYALHDAEPDTVRCEPVLRALEDICRSGKARAVAVASDAAAAASAVATGAPYGVVQLALPAPGASTAILERVAEAKMGCITHSVFGVEGALSAMEKRLKADPAARAEIRAARGTDDSDPSPARLLLERAFALNPEGVVLTSMFSERSRTQNLLVAHKSHGLETARLVDRLAS